MSVDLTSSQRQFLKSSARILETALNIGKSGISQGAIKHLDKILEARELVKVRLLESGPEDRAAAGEELAQATGAALIDVVGRVIVLYRHSRSLPPEKRLELPE